MMNRNNPMWPALGGCLAMAAAMGIGRFVYTPILPVMIAALDWSKLDAGLAASANFLGYMLGALVVGRPIFAARPRHWLLAALAVSTATTAGMAATTQLYPLMAMRFAAGVASAFVIICASTLVLERLAAAGRGRLAAVHFAGVGAGIVASAVIVAALTGAGAGWQAMWLVSGLAALVASLIAARLIPSGSTSVVAEQPQQSSNDDTALAGIALAHGLFGFGYVITATFLVTIVRETESIRLLESWIWVLVGIATIPSVPLWQWLGSRIGLLRAYAIACLVEAVAVTASVEWESVTGVCISAVLLGGTFMGLTALGITGARVLSGGRVQRAIGLTTASFGFGQMVGPTVAGVLSQQSGSLRSASLAAAAALVLAALLAYGTSMVEQRGKITARSG